MKRINVYIGDDDELEIDLSNVGSAELLDDNLIKFTAKNGSVIYSMEGDIRSVVTTGINSDEIKSE